MKESRFIELLNLYVDQQLSAPEAAELESEINRNAERRTTYRQYCRMQKACTLLFEQERTQAPASQRLAASLRDADRKIVAFPNGHERAPRGYFAVGLFAAAACVAFVFVRFNGSPTESTSAQPFIAQQPTKLPTLVAAAPSPSVSENALPVTIPAVAELPRSETPERARYYSVFATQRVPSRSREAVEETSSDLAADATTTPVVSYAWMRDVELEPVQSLSSSRLTLHNTSLANSEDRVLRSRKPMQGVTEMGAFTFQR